MIKVYPKFLSELKKGQKAIVEGFTQLENSFRLIEMGIFPGLELRVLFYSFLGDPIYIDFDKGKSHLILSKEQARGILIKYLPSVTK